MDSITNPQILQDYSCNSFLLFVLHFLINHVLLLLPLQAIKQLDFLDVLLFFSNKCIFTRCRFQSSGISPIHSTPESFISLLISFLPKQSIQTALNIQFQFMQTHCNFFHWFRSLIFIEISCHWNLISFFVFFSSIHASGAYGNTSLLKYSLISSVSGTFSVSRRDVSATGFPFFNTISPLSSLWGCSTTIF